MKKVLVTGGAGFIGSYVIEELQRRGLDVMTFDHNAPGTLTQLPDTRGIEFFFGDIRDATAVTEAAAHVDGIIHLAAVLGTQETIDNPRPAAETNILGGLNVLEAANQYNLPVVYAGVGNHWMRSEGGGTYTISKTTVEDFAKMFNKYRQGLISVVRPVNAYGPRQSIAAPYGPSKVRKIMPSFTCRALLGHEIEVYGDGEQVSDCIHVRDVAKVFVTALEYTHREGPLAGAVEVGPTESSTVNQVAELVREYAYSATGNWSHIFHSPMRPGEVPNAVVAADWSTLGYVDIDPGEFISLEDGIAETVKWYHENWYEEFTGG